MPVLTGPAWLLPCQSAGELLALLLTLSVTQYPQYFSGAQLVLASLAMPVVVRWV